MSAFDIWFDFKHGIPVRHLFFEILVFFICLFGFNFFISKFINFQKKQSAEMTSIKVELNDKDHQLSGLKQRLSAYKESFAKDLNETFKKWRLTKAESEVAKLLMKGLSIKEIAEVRHSHENTVRSQCTSIYKKSKLSNRSQLSSYFLDDLI